MRLMAGLGGRKAAVRIAKAGLPLENAVKTAVVELQAAWDDGLSDQALEPEARSLLVGRRVNVTRFVGTLMSV
jgi:hypothetical protein